MEESAESVSASYECYSIRALVDSLSPVVAQVTVCTGDVRGANTDGEVLMMMGGTAGESDWITLFSDDSDFSRGAVNKFTVQGVDMGDNRWVKLRLVRDLIDLTT